MGLELQQTQKLKLNMTQSLYQAISLLQYNHQELHDYLYQQSLENPFIDLIEQPKNAQNYDGSYFRKGIKSTTDVIEEVTPTKTHFRDDLFQQVQYLKIDTQLKQALYYLINNLDDRGYLTISLEDISDEIHLPVEICEQALHVLQGFEPFGIGARDLQECLLIQLRHHKSRNEIAEKLVIDFFDVLTEEPSELASLMDVSEESIQQALLSIQMCQPTPVLAVQEPIQYITPDASIVKENGVYFAVIEDQWLPKMTINDMYFGTLKQSASDTALTYATKKYREAQWLQGSLNQRRHTLEAVTKVMVQRQQAFLEQGFGALLPMTLKDVAEELAIHESTVSRTIKNKYIQTHYGVIPFKRFFATGVTQSSTRPISSEQIKALVVELISRENNMKPYSDQKIVELLNERHQIKVSRRAIAKYRNSCGIPSSSKRKKKR